MKTSLSERIFKSVFLVVLTLLFGVDAFASPAQLTYQGRILNSNGTPLEFNNVAFIFQVTDPSGSCIIYQESMSGYSMVNSGGVFDLPIGNNTMNYPVAGFTILDAFNNSSTYQCGSCSGYTCSAGGSTYNAANGDIRKLRVQFYDGTGWKTISPDNVIRSVPFAGYALSAQKLGTNVSSDFLLKAVLPTCSSGTFLSWDGSALTCAGISGANGGTVTNVTSANSYLTVANGTSTPQLTLNVGTIANTVAAGNDSRIVNAMQVGAAAGGDLSGNYPDPKVAALQGVALSTSAPTSGQVLKYNGTNWAGAVLTTSDISGLSTNYVSQAAFNGFIASAGCTAGQTMYWNSVSATFQCQTTAITSSQVSFGSQAQNTFFAAPSTGAGTPSFRTLASSDLPAGTISGSGTAGYLPYYSTDSTLANSPVYTTGSNVGIGTTSPGWPLQINGSGDVAKLISSTSSSGLLLGDTSNTVRFGTRSGALIMDTNSAERMRITTAGNVLVNQSATYTINTMTTPLLQVANIGDASIGQSTFSNISAGFQSRIQLNRSRGASVGDFTAVQSGDGLGAIHFAGTDGTNFIAAAQISGQADAAPTTGVVPGRLMFLTSNSSGSVLERMRIDSNGNVGISTSSPTAKLHLGVAPTATTNYPLFALGSGAFDGSTSGFFTGSANGTVIGINTASGYTGDLVNYQVGGSSKFKVDYLGNITYSGTMSASGNTTSTGNYSTSGNISTIGAGTITSAGTLTANSGTASTSPTTGALVVNGGAGISGALNVGGTSYLGNSSTNYVTITGASTGNSPVIATAGADTNINLTFSAKGTGNTIFSHGNVGIGTTSPAGALQITSTSNTDIRLDSSSATPSALRIVANSGTNFIQSGTAYTTNSAADLSFGPMLSATTSWLYLKSNGNVGIGTSSPSFPLTVYGNPSNTGTTGLNSALYPTATTTGSYTNYAGQIWNSNSVATSVTNSGSQVGLVISSLRNNNGTSTDDSGILSNLTSASVSYGHQNINSAATPTTTTAYGLKISPYLQSGAITTAYDLYLNSTTGTEASITTHYGIYQSNIYAKNYLASPLGLGSSTTPAYPLEISSPGLINYIPLSLYNSGTATGLQHSVDVLFDQYDTNASARSTYGKIRVQKNSAGSSSGFMSFYTTNSGTNAEKMRLDSSGNLGVGTTSPVSILNISSNTAPSVFIDGYAVAPQLAGRYATGTSSSPSAATADSPLFFTGGRGYGATAFASASSAGMYAKAAENFTDSAQGGYLTFETTPTGAIATSRAERMRITASGNVGI